MPITKFPRLEELLLSETESAMANQLWNLAQVFEWYEFYPYRMEELSKTIQNHPYASTTTKIRMKIIVIDVLARYIRQSHPKHIKNFMNEFDRVLDEDYRLIESYKMIYRFFPTLWNRIWGHVE